MIPGFLVALTEVGGLVCLLERIHLIAGRGTEGLPRAFIINERTIIIRKVARGNLLGDRRRSHRHHEIVKKTPSFRHTSQVSINTIREVIQRIRETGESRNSIPRRTRRDTGHMIERRVSRNPTAILVVKT